MKAVTPHEIKKLSTPEKIILAEDIWDSIQEKDDSIPIPASHKHELNRRLRKYPDASGDFLTWEQVRKRIR